MKTLAIAFWGITLLPVFFVAQNDQLQIKGMTSDVPEIHALTDTSITLNLEYGFRVVAGEAEELGSTTTYTFFQLQKDNTIIFTNETLVEYEFKNPMFPMVLKTGPAVFELIFEINDRPFKNYLRRFFVKDNQLVKQDKLPVFVGNAVDTNHDGLKEFAGYWRDGEVWGPKYEHTAYNPILFYTLKESGLQLDTALTIERNTSIYGAFQGYDYDENKEHPVSVMKKFDAVLKLYESNGARK